MARHRVAPAAELASDDDAVAVACELHALPNFCPHQAAPLCEGELTGRMVVGDDGWEWRYEQEGEIVTCPWHGWKFDVTTGDNIKDDRYAVPTYDVREEGGAVYVER